MPRNGQLTRLAELRAHPAYDRLFRIYRNARIDWYASGAIQSAAATLGQDERAYADARLVANQISWSATNTTGPLTREHFDLAYEEAAPNV